MNPKAKSSYSQMRSGTTLVELLITLAVIGSLVAVATVSLISYQQYMALQQGATQFATDLALARSKARRSSLNWEVRIKTLTEYKLGDSVFSLPAGAKFDDTSVGKSITFAAPYGLVATAPTTVELKGKGNRRLMVNVVGLGGKVVIRAP